MGVFTFICKESGGKWTAKQYNGDLEGSSDSTFNLQRKLIQEALSKDSSGCVQSSFSIISPSSAVFQIDIKPEREGVNKELRRKSSKSSREESLPKISINTRLAAEILLLEASKGSSGKNVVCSPLSLEFAMHMVAVGSKEETLSQMLKFIGSKDYPLESMEDLNLKSLGIMKFASSFDKSEKEQELTFANGVWVDGQNKLKPSYKELMSSIYNARAELVNFKEQADQIIEDINSWVADKTKGLIKDIMTPGTIGYTSHLSQCSLL